MGQYYLLVNIDKRQWLHVLAARLSIINTRTGPQESTISICPMRTGGKLCEQLYDLGLKPLLALALIQLNGPIINVRWGSWAGDRIVLIGDYSDEPPPFLTPEEQAAVEGFGGSLYHFAQSQFTQLDSDPQLWLEPFDNLGAALPQSLPHVVLNIDANQHLDPLQLKSSGNADAYGMEPGGIMQALFSCLFYSSGSGSGDIEAFKQGRWAGQHILITSLTEAHARGSTDISAEVQSVLDRADND